MQQSLAVHLDAHRHAVAALLSAGLAVLWAFAQPGLPSRVDQAHERLMDLVWAAPTTPPAPALPRPPAPAAVPPARAEHATDPVAAHRPVPASVPSPSQAPATAPQLQDSAAAEASARGPVGATMPAATPPAAYAIPTPATPSTGNVQAAYVGQLRALLDATKRYPTGREASLRRPHGKVVVWFVLTRTGALQDAGIDQGSDSHLLDQAALATVRRAIFPPFPDGAWPGTGSHRFTATLDFLPPG